MAANAHAFLLVFLLIGYSFATQYFTISRLPCSLQITRARGSLNQLSRLCIHSIQEFHIIRIQFRGKLCLKLTSSLFTTTSHNKESRSQIRLLFCPLVRITPSPPPEDVMTFWRLSLSLPSFLLFTFHRLHHVFVVFKLFFFFPCVVCCFLPSKLHLVCFLSSFVSAPEKNFLVFLCVFLLKFLSFTQKRATFSFFTHLKEEEEEEEEEEKKNLLFFSSLFHSCCGLL